MAGQLSNYLENALINGTLRNTQYNSPALVYLALYTTDPTDADIGNECSLVAYARQVITFSVPNDGVSTNLYDIVFPVVTSGSQTITHIGIRDAYTVGNLLFYAPLAVSRVLVINDQLIINAGQLLVTLA